MSDNVKRLMDAVGKVLDDAQSGGGGWTADWVRTVGPIGTVVGPDGVLAIESDWTGDHVITIRVKGKVPS